MKVKRDIRKISRTVLGMQKVITSGLLSIFFFFSCGGSSIGDQNKGSQVQENEGPHLLGNCEGCEAVFEFGDRELTSTDTLPDFDNEGTRIHVTGRVFEENGKEPAEDVILYFYHTNQEGKYEPKGEVDGWERRHGYIRGWVRTGEDGRYSIYTLKPGNYPNGNNPAHIHVIVLEPDSTYYWLGSYHFKGDPLLSPEKASPKNPRGGSSGLLDLKEKNGILSGKRDIILRKNVPQE